eukprot:TRINITY_DN1330_c0_g2_i4.p1 TRINITY_DN1330_c0_g2~~TRINITY_DN1330_c0_g2_i4.p1  ORF type:complete len:685 (+),score=88.24 TRINITY_DN1330_c0_g2_i4:129-2183(+)
MAIELRRVVNDVHDRPVLSLSYSAFYREIYTGSEDGSIRAWDRETGRYIRHLGEHKGWVTGLHYHPDHKILFSASVDGRIVAWSPTGVIHDEDLKTPIYCMAWDSRRQQLVVGCHSYIRSFVLLRDNIEQHKRPILRKGFTVKAHHDVIRGLAYFEGKVYSASYDRSIACHDSESLRKVIHMENCHMAGISTLVMDTDNSWIITGSFDRTVRLWSQDCKLLHKFDGFEDTISGLCYIPITRTLWASDGGTSLTALDLRTTSKITEYLTDRFLKKPRQQEETLFYQKLFWVPELQEMVAFTSQRQLVFWKYNTCAALSICRDHTDGVETICYSHRLADLQIFSGGSDGLLRKWEPMQLNSQIYSPEVIVTHPGIAIASVFHDTTETLIMALNDNSIRMMPYERVSQRLTELARNSANDHADRVSCLKIVGDILISASWDCTCRFWDIPNRAMIDVLKQAHDDAILWVDYSPKLNAFATSSADRLIKVWDFERKTLIASFSGHAAEVLYVFWNQPFNCWVSASEDRTLRFWTIEGQQAFEPIDTKGEALTAMCVDKTTGYVVVALRDKAIHLFDPKSGRVVQTYMGHTDEVRSIIHVQEQAHYITCSWDQTIRIWNAYRDKASARHRQVVRMAAEFAQRDEPEEVRSNPISRFHILMLSVENQKWIGFIFHDNVCLSLVSASVFFS